MKGLPKQKVVVHEMDRIDFSTAWKLQEERLNEMRTNKTSTKIPIAQRKCVHHLFVCEHNPVYTLGKSGKQEHLLLSEKELKEKGFEYYKINRGGDITYHGPGQLTVYPILDLDFFYHDIHRYVRNLEECVIQFLKSYNVVGTRIKGFTGVWIDGNPSRKICAIGVHMSRWISMHGFALNIETDLSHFENIVPCGINEKEKTITSLAQELNKEIDLAEAKHRLLKSFADCFEVDLIT